MVTGDQCTFGIPLTNCVRHLNLSLYIADKHNGRRHQREPCPILQTYMTLDSRVVYAPLPGLVSPKIADKLTLEVPGLNGDPLEELQSVVDEELGGKQSHNPLVAVTHLPQLRLNLSYPADSLGHIGALF